MHSFCRESGLRVNSYQSQRRARAAVPGTVAAAYAAVTPSPPDARPEPGFALSRPYYFEAHTGPSCACAAARTPLHVAGPTLHYGRLPGCPSCAARAAADPRAPAGNCQHAFLLPAPRESGCVHSCGCLEGMPISPPHPMSLDQTGSLALGLEQVKPVTSVSFSCSITCVSLPTHWLLQSSPGRL